MNMREEFKKWLFDGNARGYSPKVILSCIDKISEYALNNEMVEENLWEYKNPRVFGQIYTNLISSKSLRIADRKTRKAFITAGKFYQNFLKEKPSRHRADAVSTVIEDKNMESTDSLISLEREFINPEAVISWLITQPNANGSLYLESVTRQYMRTLQSTPVKFEMSIEQNDRNVFNCRTAEELNALWNIFKTAPNYKQVNRNTSGMFSAGMSCLLRYLQNREKTTPSLLLDSEVILKLTDVLSSYYPNGYRLNSPIELVRFKSFVADIFGAEITMPDELLEKHISACGIAYNDKIYVVSTETKEQIKKIALEYFSTGAQVIFFEEFYVKNEKWLVSASIVSAEMLITIFRELFPKSSFTQAYFGYSRDSIFKVLENEILRVWGENTLLTYEQLAERLAFIPLERIKYALGQNGDFIWNSVGSFSHISRIKITDAERKAIRDLTENKYNVHGYVSITDLPLGEIEERNYELSTTGIHNAIYRICLLDKFDKKGKIIMRKGDTFDALSIMKEYCSTLDKCSLRDLLNFEKELTGEVHRWIPMEAGNAVMVRIDKDTYVADKYVNFNVDLTDKALEQFVKGAYLPLKAFTTFGLFPDCGQIWNLFLLESYCRRFSKEFRIDALSVNSRNAGAIVRKSCSMDYIEIMADAIANADILLNDTNVGQYLFDNGYTGRSTTSKVREIIAKAKDIRERRS